jgi:hypothetical protein
MFPQFLQHHATTCGSFGSLTVSINRSISHLQRGHILFMTLLFLVVVKATRHSPDCSIPYKPQKNDVVEEFSVLRNVRSVSAFAPYEGP